MEVASHTSLKHRMLGAYFKICRQIMKKRTLHYIDLYVGDGKCHCEESPLKEWECPFICGLIKRAKKENLRLKCYINDIAKENLDKLKKILVGYEEYIEKIEQEDANKIYKEFLKIIPNNEWAIFFLDPYKHTELDWETIENISKHEGYDVISQCNRKPELIINFMTLSMQRMIKTDPNSITQALGTEEWVERIKKRGSKKMYEIFLEIFMDRLEKLGYYTTSFEITQTLPNRNVLYYLVFATNIESANKIITSNYKPYIDKIMNDKWIKENFSYRMITKAKADGNRLIEDFIKPKI